MSWLERYKWLVYSFASEGAFCIYCALFDIHKANRGYLVVSPYKENWRKFTDYANAHEKLKYHEASYREAADFLARRQTPSLTVTQQLSANVAKNVARNREIVECVIKEL